MSVEFGETEWIAKSVSGNTLTAVAKTISHMPAGEAAAAEWLPRYDYQTVGEVLTDVLVTVETRITMPRWSSYETAPEAEQSEWDRFCSALRAHEQGHIDLVVEHLHDIDERLVGKSASAAQQVWAKALDSLESANSAYDQETDHGRNEGAVIDVTVAGL